MIIDASNIVAGRMASKVAKMLLEGENVIIINAEKAVISGKPESTHAFFKSKVDRGSRDHGPFYPKKSNMLLRRIIRGMLPIRKAKGRIAFKKLRVYEGCPEIYKNKDVVMVGKNSSELVCKYITIKDISKKLGR